MAAVGREACVVSSLKSHVSVVKHLRNSGLSSGCEQEE